MVNGADLQLETVDLLLERIALSAASDRQQLTTFPVVHLRRLSSPSLTLRYTIAAFVTLLDIVVRRRTVSCSAVIYSLQFMRPSDIIRASQSEISRLPQPSLFFVQYIARLR